MQRRKFISGMLATAAGVAIASPVRSVNGAVHSRFYSVAEESVSAKDYVQDGLVAMWDGIENAGWGVHDANATTWKDITGNEPDLYDLYGGDLEFGKNCLLGRRIISPFNDSSGRLFNDTQEYTVECCFVNSGMSYGCFAFSNGRQGSTYGTGISRSTWTRNLSVPTSLGFIFGNKTTEAGEISYGDVAHFSISHGQNHSCYQNGIFLCHAESSPNQKTSLMVGNFSSPDLMTKQECCFSEYYCFRIYNRELSPSEIEWNHMIDLVRFGL